jgi:hypothetical protein
VLPATAPPLDTSCFPMPPRVTPTSSRRSPSLRWSFLRVPRSPGALPGRQLAAAVARTEHSLLASVLLSTASPTRAHPISLLFPPAQRPLNPNPRRFCCSAPASSARCGPPPSPLPCLSHPIYKNINRAIIYASGSSHAYIQQNHQDITTRISK